jgi:uncharacterized membrane protein
LVTLARYPADLALLSVFLCSGLLGIGRLPADSVLRFAVAFPVLFLCPGYAVVSVLYPTQGALPVAGMNRTVVRLALSFGLSLAIVPVVVIGISAAGTVGFLPVLTSLGVGALLVMQIAVVRRLRVPEARRYRLRIRRPVVRYIDAFRGRRSSAQFTSVLLLVGLVVAASTLFVAMGNPPSENNFTELYVGTENENGTVTTAEYPEALSQETPLVVSVTNHESTVKEYVVVVQLQEVDDTGEVTSREELDRFRSEVEVGETWQQSHRPTARIGDDDRRLQYLLYCDEPPQTPTETNAYRTVHIWVGAG